MTGDEKLFTKCICESCGIGEVLGEVICGTSSEFFCIQCQSFCGLQSENSCPHQGSLCKMFAPKGACGINSNLKTVAHIKEVFVRCSRQREPAASTPSSFASSRQSPCRRSHSSCAVRSRSLDRSRLSK